MASTIASASFYPAAMPNPIQQGLKHYRLCCRNGWNRIAAMPNPIQQGLKPGKALWFGAAKWAAMPNPIQQGLKHESNKETNFGIHSPQCLIQYNKD